MPSAPRLMASACMRSMASFAGLVEGLGEAAQFGVLHRSHGLSDAPMSDVVDAGAHDHAEGRVTRLHQSPEVLPGQVRGEGLARRRFRQEPGLSARTLRCRWR